ncbi:MAG TPA: OmpW family outer membrane protein [Wenzhouxiangella sp.]|nr:OmpW family outer membrane protein [Wenzhouxiangella sp.]
MNIRIVSTLAVAGLLSANVMAHDAGELFARVGLGYVSPDTDSNNLVVGGTELAGYQIDVGNNTRPIIELGYMFTDSVAVEVLAAWPFKHDIDGAGTALDGAGKLGETSHLPPTVSLQYYFAPGSSFRPYIGAGVNYTTFFSEDTTATLDGALGGPSDLSISDSFGLALQIGADYYISDNLFLNVSARYIQIEADATIKTQTDAGQVVSRIKADIDPMVLSAGLGFHF